ncbi:unnamed protein product [Ascophyllum nodosum]
MSSFGRFGNRDHAVGEFCIWIKPLDGKDHARKRPLTVKSWSTVKDLKDILQSLLHVPAASQRLFFRGGELRNPRTLQDCGIYRNGQTLYLATSPQDEMGKPYSLEPFLGAGGLPRSLVRVLGQAKRGLDRGFKPELTLEGTGGTYFLQDAARQKVAVFKPRDEEPFAPNNPRDAMQGGLGGGTVSMRPGIDAGESYVREVAAYILDDRHLHGVPATTLVEAKHPAFCYWDHKERVKLGSFQEFVRHDMVVEDISPSRLSPREVQKIALLDMRILNRDRNSVNILVRSRPRRASSFSERSKSGDSSAYHRHRSSEGSVGLSTSAPGVSNAGLSSSRPGASSSRYEGGLSNSGRGEGGRRSSRLLGGGTEYELIPIDHGLCLSDELVIDWCDWCWLDWRQVKQPIDPELYSYIQSFDPEATAEKLGNTLNLKEGGLRNLRIAEILLKEGAATGLTLYDIACIMRREDFDKISELENLVARANELARAAVDHQTSAALSKRVQNFSAKGFDSRNSVRSRQNHRSNEILDLDPENNGGWLIPGALEEAADAERPCANDPQESSTEASSEDLTPSIDLRASGESMDSSGGEGSEAPLRIWAPGSRSISLGASPSVGMPFSLSRGSSCSDAAAAAEGKGRLSSPTQSAESDTDLISPVGFWQENFETIDARNATRKFSRWEDSCSVEEASLEERTGSGSSDGGGSGSSNLTGGKSGGNSASLRDVPRGQSDSAGGVDVGVGRKLFPSAERQRPPPVMTSSSQALAADLETMAEGDHEFPSPMGPLGGEAEAEAVPFWASAMEPAWDKLFGGIGRAERGAEEKESGGLGWRRGEAGLVVPEPLAPKSRSVTIQQVIQQCGSRTGDNPTAAGGAKKTITPPRPASASLAPPTGGVDESKAQPEPQTLSQGVRIVRSYSYHGLGSLALYDSANRGSARYALRKRPNENSEQFKACFFRFYRLLVRDFVKRRHRSIIKERGAFAARQAAEKCSSAAAAATAAANAAIENGGGRLGRRPPPAAPSKSKSSSPHPAVPAAVLG